MLSGLAFLTACCSSKSCSRSERRELIRERDSIQEILSRRENACVYGTPEIIESYGAETARLRQRVNEINDILDGKVKSEEADQPADPELQQDLDTVEEVIEIQPVDKIKRRAELQQQLDSLNNIIKDREMACVYGSPEVMQSYSEETSRKRQQAAAIQKELEELDGEE